MASESITAENKKWEAESDARTLAEAHIILQDSKRLKSARNAASKLAKEQADNLEGMLRVAGKLGDKVEGMKIVEDRIS